MDIKETVYATRRPSQRDNGGNYDSGFITVKNLKLLVETAEQSGLDAIGFAPKYVKGAKVNEKTGKAWEGTVIEIKAFKLKAK